MITNDPNRLLVIIRDRHIMVRRLEAALKEAKVDNRGDAFKINRFIKYHKDLLVQLEQDMRNLTSEDYAHRKLEAIRVEKEQVAILRQQLQHWRMDNEF